MMVFANQKVTDRRRDISFNKSLYILFWYYIINIISLYPKSTTMRNPNPSKRIKTLGLHEWTDNELIVNFYVTKFGMTNLKECFRSVDDLCGHMGLKPYSFHLQECNFRMLMGKKDRVLSDYSKTQQVVFELFNSEPLYRFYQIVKDILKIDTLVRQKYLHKN